jgi:citrate synthase
MAELVDAPPGLKGVVAAETAIGDVRGEEGFYHYRQYDAIELALTRTLEEVWCLLLDGQLPGPGQLAAFVARAARARPVPPDVTAALPVIAALASGAQPLHALRAAYELVVLHRRPPSWLDVSPEDLLGQAIAAGAVFPTLVVALHRLTRGLELIGPRPDLGHAANYLYMLEGREPPERRVRALESYLISTVDHGFNASTFTARVVTSTGGDLGSAVIAALGSLSGPLHGGAPARVLDMLDAIGTPERAGRWIRDTLGSGGIVMGFGHPVYRTTDPRNTMLRTIAEELGSPRLELAIAVEQQALAAFRELRPGVPIYANVEFYASVVLDAIGLPRELFTPTFAISRVIGWTAHIVEQAAHNKILRPSARYVGPPPDPGARQRQV